MCSAEQRAAAAVQPAAVQAPAGDDRDRTAMTTTTTATSAAPAASAADAHSEDAARGGKHRAGARCVRGSDRHIIQSPLMLVKACSC